MQMMIHISTFQHFSLSLSLSLSLSPSLSRVSESAAFCAFLCSFCILQMASWLNKSADNSVVLYTSAMFYVVLSLALMMIAEIPLSF